jgi:hypothetical protein
VEVGDCMPCHVVTILPLPFNASLLVGRATPRNLHASGAAGASRRHLTAPYTLVARLKTRA